MLALLEVMLQTGLSHDCLMSKEKIPSSRCHGNRLRARISLSSSNAQQMLAAKKPRVPGLL